jgi:hypothetical protein
VTVGLRDLFISSEFKSYFLEYQNSVLSFQWQIYSYTWQFHAKILKIIQEIPVEIFALDYFRTDRQQPHAIQFLKHETAQHKLCSLHRQLQCS